MKIQIEAELSNYIESLHYDRNSIQELLLMAEKQGLKDRRIQRMDEGLPRQEQGIRDRKSDAGT